MQIKYELDEGAYAPVRAHDSDAGFDLSCMEDQMLEGNKANTIDTGYTGSIRVVLEPFNVTWIFKGNRIAQLVILPLPNIKMIEGKVIGVDTHRGAGGFGSTGA
jgi:dUTPase